MDSVKNSKSKKEKYLYLVIVSVIIISSIVLIILIKDYNNKQDMANKPKEPPRTTKKPEFINNQFDYNYKYILDYEHLSITYYIYLLKDNSIKIVSKEKVYEVCPEENCIKETGEIKYTEEDVNLNDKAYDKARKTISSLFTNTDRTELNMMEGNIDNSTRLVLDGIIEGNSDKVTLVEDLKIAEKKEDLNNSKGEKIFAHSYNYISDSENLIVKAISEHINQLVLKDYQEMVEYSKEFIENIEQNDYLGVSLKLKVESLTDSEISISYITEGSLGGTSWFMQHGYIYSITDGKLKEYPDNKREIAYKSALDNFKQSELYLKESNQLNTNYETVLKNEMFKTGNYYVTDTEVVFVIDGSLLGFNSATAKVVEIRIAIDNNY